MSADPRSSPLLRGGVAEKRGSQSSCRKSTWRRPRGRHGFLALQAASSWPSPACLASQRFKLSAAWRARPAGRRVGWRGERVPASRRALQAASLPIHSNTAQGGWRASFLAAADPHPRAGAERPSQPPPSPAQLRA